MSWSAKFAVAAIAAVLAGGSPCLAAPLILYNSTAPGVDDPVIALPSSGTNCGSLTSPCTNTNLTASKSIIPPEVFLPGWTYGVSGEASVGVSNHGNAESIGVTAWAQKDDFSIGLSLTTSQQNYDSKYYTFVPINLPRH